MHEKLKRFLIVITAIWLGESSLFAMPVLNPSQPQDLNRSIIFSDKKSDLFLKGGFRGDYVFARKMICDTGTRSRNVSLYSNEALLSIQFCNQVSLYGFIGASTLEVNGFRRDNFNSTPNIVFLNMRSETTPILGFGFKCILWRGNIAFIGQSFVAFDAQYEQVVSANFKVAKVSGFQASANMVGFSYREQQYSLTLGHKIGAFEPYFAFKWSSARINPQGHREIVYKDNTITFRSYKSFKNEGLALGASYYSNATMNMIFEVRIVDELASTICWNMKF